MAKIGVFFAEGYEEIEALTVVDLCRRAGIEVEMISAYDRESVCGSHGIDVKMDKGISEVDFDSLDMIVLPGGMPGTLHLEVCSTLMEQLDGFYQNGRYVAAICAAPSIFGHRGYLKGRKAVCYPSFEEDLTGADVQFVPALTDGHVICGRGMGCAIDFSLEIIKALVSAQKAESIAESVIYQK